MATAIRGIETGPTSHLAPTFTAYRLSEKGESYRLDVCASVLNDAVSHAAMRCQHKDTFYVVASDPIEGRTVAHFYAVKRSSKPIHTLVDHVPTRIHGLYAHKQFSMLVAAFEPVEPWQWTPGADVVGRPAQLISRGL